MPGSGVNLLWDETKPAETDVADAAPIRSIETSLRNGLAVEHNWPTATGANFGYHLLGSARAYYDVESNVSSSGTDGRILVTSDTSRIFHVGSAGTMFLGGQTALSMGSSPVGGQRYYWAIEAGTAQEGSGSFNPLTITFPNSGFSGVPFFVASMQTNFVGTVGETLVITGLGATSANIRTVNTGTGLAVNGNYVINWMSIGTRVL